MGISTGPEDDLLLNRPPPGPQLYCGKDHPPLEKEKRNVFVVGDIEEIRGDFQSLMRYCARDVAATSQVLRVLYPLFRQRCPHPATLGKPYQGCKRSLFERSRSQDKDL